jgi:hypothetical protein
MMASALDKTFDAMEERAWTGHPILRATKRDELKRLLIRYLDWEAEHHKKMEGSRGKAPTILRTAADKHELRFDASDDVVLERNGVRFEFRGSIDRVDVGVDPRIDKPERFVAAIDYKSSLGSVPGKGTGAAWDDGVVLQVPLYAFALAQILKDVDVSRVEYRALNETKPKASPGKAYPHCLQLYEVNHKTGELEWNESDAEKMDRALDAVSAHVLSIRRGEFPVAPAPSCKCPSYCHAYDICRVSASKREGRA